MNASGRRRGFKSWFVEPYRQVKLGLMFMLLNLAFAGMILGIFGYYMLDVYQALAVYFKLTSDQSNEILLKFQVPIVAGAVLILVFVASSILLAVRYTHQIYGPLVSIHRFLDEYLQGAHVNPLILRQSDQLKELADKLNILVTQPGVEKRQSSLRPIYKYLDDLLAGGNPEPIRLRDSDPYQDLADRLHAIGELMKRQKIS